MKTAFFPHAVVAACLLSLPVIWTLAQAGEPDYLDEFLDVRGELLEERRGLEATIAGLPPEERMAAIREWRQNERHRFERVREIAQAMADAETATPSSFDQERKLPPGLSAEMRELLELRGRLRDERMSLERALATASGREKMEALRSWRESRDASFQKMRELTEALPPARASSRPPLWRQPPDHLSPMMRDFLALRHELLAERYEIEAKYANASGAEKITALREWRESRAPTFDDLRRLTNAIASGEE